MTTTSHTSHQRQSLRKQLKRNRTALTDAQQQANAVGLAQQFARSPFAWRAGKIASYLAGNAELDTKLIHQHCWATQRSLSVPVVRSQQLEFYALDADTNFTLNQFGLREPASGVRFVDTRSISMMLVPLVGFDDNGNRLGMGGGFYDRHLGRLPKGLRPTLIGVAHECQRAEQIPVEPWDVPLDGLLTEQRWQWFANKTTS